MSKLDDALGYVDDKLEKKEASNQGFEPDMGSTMATYLQVQATLLLAAEIALLNELLGHPAKGELVVAASPLQRIANTLEGFQATGLPISDVR